MSVLNVSMRGLFIKSSLVQVNITRPVANILILLMLNAT